jgi:hypothetical protein
MLATMYKPIDRINREAIVTELRHNHMKRGGWFFADQDVEASYAHPERTNEGLFLEIRLDLALC